MGRVVVAVAGLVVAIGKDSQLALRVRRCQLGFCAYVVEGLAACVELEV